MTHSNRDYLPFPGASADLERRTAIKQLAAFCGLALSASSMSLMANSFSLPTDMSRNKKTFFGPSQLALVMVIGELIIPTTDTPGAIAAGVHDFINHQATYCLSPTDQDKLTATLTKISASAKEKYGKDFLACSSSEQTYLLTDMEQAQNGFTPTDRGGFKQLKGLVIFGYYTSKIGATQELAYLAIPGGYKGDFKFKQIGKAWSLN